MIMRIWLWLALAVLLRGEEWFMPNSHLISEDEFQGKINGDGSTFKMVKFFSQNCVYCRYLKMVVDQLKAQKTWCFEMYDFNCGWYPQFCYQNVQATSFPYTAIYDGRGEVFQTVSGFYPEPVMRTIFDRVEQSCLEHKASLQPAVQEQKIPETRSSLTSHEEIPPPPVVENKMPEQILEVEAPKVEPPRQQITQQQVKKEGVESVQSVSQEARSVPVLSYVFYAACSLIGGYYVYHIHTTAQPQEVKVGSVGGTQAAPVPQNTSSQVKNEESELLASLPDDQL